MSIEPAAASSTAASVIAIFGPTASGKSALAEAVADQLETEVISADAMQVYRDVPILTNQPSRPTRLVAIRELGETMSVGEYERLAHAAIDEIVAQRGSVVVAGGTGLYLRAALTDLRLPPPPPPGLREETEALVASLGPGAAHTHLAALDPAAAAAVHANDHRRLVRALELVALGRSLAPSRDRLWSGEMRRPTLLIGLDVPPNELEQRIRARTAEMIERGAGEEARRAAVTSKTARHVMGLEELRTLPAEEALEAIVIRTRRYAAYQRKWMRRLPLDAVLDGTRPSTWLAAEVIEAARAGGQCLS
ncbi:MAG: tRNA (adenosine(37)-N6)-dimethylallyltransferase MiaA [Gaiellales bacterium]